MNKISSSSFCHRRIILIVNLVLLYTEVNGVNLLLHDRDGLLHG
jgi:hypothetical protein